MMVTMLFSWWCGSARSSNLSNLTPQRGEGSGRAAAGRRRPPRRAWAGVRPTRGRGRVSATRASMETHSGLQAHRFGGRRTHPATHARQTLRRRPLAPQPPATGGARRGWRRRGSAEANRQRARWPSPNASC